MLQDVKSLKHFHFVIVIFFFAEDKKFNKLLAGFNPRQKTRQQRTCVLEFTSKLYKIRKFYKLNY